MARINPLVPRGLGDAGENFFQQFAPGSLRPLQPSTGEAGIVPPPTAVREVPFDTWEAYAFVVGLVPLRLDTAAILRRDRRAVMVVNSHVANGLWLGHSAGVAVNNGVFVPPNGGAISLPLSERAQVWAVSSGAGTVASLAQFA